MDNNNLNGIIISGVKIKKNKFDNFYSTLPSAVLLELCFDTLGI